MTGGDATDLIFGQGGNDVISGEGDADYIEGNDGNDAIGGGDADDDIMGGGSANDGLIDGDRVGNTLRDVGETVVTGGPGLDWITGDNGLVNRNVLIAHVGRAPIELFDVQTAGRAGDLDVDERRRPAAGQRRQGPHLRPGQRRPAGDADRPRRRPQQRLRRDGPASPDFDRLAVPPTRTTTPLASGSAT